jgi:hypothetical protein
MSYPDSLIIQGNLTFGSGGTTIDVWVQTSIDGGYNWTDIAGPRRAAGCCSICHRQRR